MKGNSVKSLNIFLFVSSALFATRTAQAADPFTIAVLPDTQFYVDDPANVHQFNAQTQWIVDNRQANNIVFATHLGDLVQNFGNGNNGVEWTRADAAMSILDAGAPALSYGAVLGNHDHDVDSFPSNPPGSTADDYVQYFGSSRYAGKSWYGGASSDEFNHYQRFTAGGRDFLNISLEWIPRPSSITWAQQILDANPNTPTIISTHEYTDPGRFASLPGQRTGVGDDIFNSLVNDNSQVFLTLSGHWFGEASQIVTNAAGDEVIEMVANYQNRANGGNGWLRLLEFDEDNDQINVMTYSPTLDQFETDANSQFSIAVDFDERFGAVASTAIPEPSTLVLAMLGLAGLAMQRSR